MELELNSTIAIKGQYGQSILDLCMMGYGTSDNLIQMLLDSGAELISQVNQKVFTFQTNLIKDQNVNDYLNSKGILYATAYQQQVFAEEGLQAIFESEGGDEFIPES